MAHPSPIRRNAETHPRCANRTRASSALAGAPHLLAALTLLGAMRTRRRPSRGTPSRCTASPRCRQDFAELRYANPAAPKGGRLVHGVLGTFDSLNPLIVKGSPLAVIRGYVIESLMARGYDEPFTLYGLLARTVETDADAQLRDLRRSIRPRASPTASR